MTLRAFVGAGLAAMPRVEINEAAAPTTMAAEKLRLFIIMSVFLDCKYDIGCRT
jgi:hypothetical protein